MSSDKPWGGRFSAPTEQVVEQFTASVAFDRRLYRQDIAGSIAHARMLAAAGVLSEKDRDAIVAGLRAIESDIDSGNFAWSDRLEDVHMNIERRLTERIGEAGKRLHTARSRNDQVATDLRLYVRDAIDALREALDGLQQALVDLAARETDTIMPGFTHIQPAQPVTFGHHVMAWFEMLERDQERLAGCRARVNRSPLGAAALAGTGFPIDREFTARELGFEGLCENSLDAVSDRDFTIEFAAAGALIMVHLSRMAEEIVWWSAPQFGFVELGDAFCTGSSIMPQKKNPDVAEIVRGKSARVIGHLVALITLMKAQPLAYNRDNQEDKEPVFDTVDTLGACVRVMAAMIPTMQVNRDRMLEAARLGYTTATDLADYLVRKGVAFRDAHEVVGKLVRLAVDSGRELSALSLEEMRAESEHIDEDVFAVLTLEGSVNARAHRGGTAPARVREAVERARALLAARTAG